MLQCLSSPCVMSVHGSVCLVPLENGSRRDVPSESKDVAHRVPERYQSREQENQSIVLNSHSPEQMKRKEGHV